MECDLAVLRHEQAPLFGRGRRLEIVERGAGDDEPVFCEPAFPAQLRVPEGDDLFHGCVHGGALEWRPGGFGDGPAGCAGEFAGDLLLAGGAEFGRAEGGLHRSGPVGFVVDEDVAQFGDGGRRLFGHAFTGRFPPGLGDE